MQATDAGPGCARDPKTLQPLRGRAPFRRGGLAVVRGARGGRPVVDAVAVVAVCAA